jgi:3-hydroxyisobutyrate dehydrogenase-like beta-hydroxyacid dehydrogenase
MDPQTERTLQSEGDSHCSRRRYPAAVRRRRLAQLVYLIGGDAKALSAAEPLLKVLGSSIQHVGPIGAGSLAKLTTNTLLGVQVDTIAESPLRAPAASQTVART